MGIFDFVTDAGGKLGGAVHDLLHENEDINKPVTITPERMNELRQNVMLRTLLRAFSMKNTASLISSIIMPE